MRKKYPESKNEEKKIDELKRQANEKESNR